MHELILAIWLVGKFKEVRILIPLFVILWALNILYNDEMIRNSANFW